MLKLPNFSSLLPQKYEVKLCLLAFFSLTLSFLPLILNFTWGNHDWLALKRDGSLTAGFIEGRFSQYIFLGLFLEYHILPILNTVLGFAFYSMTIVLFATRFFNLNTNTSITPPIIILIATLPYINEITFFQFIILSQLIWTFTVFISLTFAKQASDKNFILNTFFSYILLFLSIGGYPASANLFVIATILYLLQTYNTTNNLKSTLIKSFPFIISIVISFISLYFTYRYMQNKGAMIKLYNNETVTLKELLTKIPNSFPLSLKSLITPQPFFELSYKLLSAFIIFSFIFFYLKQFRTKTNLIIRILFIIALIIGIKFSALLIKETPNSYFAQRDPAFFMIRTDFYSIPILLLFSLYFLHSNTPKFYQNLLTLIIFVLIFYNLNNNINYSKIQNLGFKGELNLMERISSRINDSSQFSPYKLYTLIQTDDISLRPRFYHQPIKANQSLYTLNSAFTRHWLPYDHYNFYAIRPFVIKNTHIDTKDFTPKMIDYISTQIDVWPSQNSLYLDDNYIFIIQTNTEKNNLQTQFKQLKSSIQ